MALLAPTLVLSSVPYLTALVQGVACSGNALKTETLIPAGRDPHTFKLTPNQRGQVEKAPLFFTIGAQFESWGKSLSAPKDATWLSVADAVTLAPAATGSHAAHSHAQGGDPHLWHSPKLSAEAVDAVNGVLGKRFPAQAAAFSACAKDVKETLAKDAEEARAVLAKIPAADRTLATNHDAFGYFAREFGLKTVSLVGLSTNAQSTPKAMAELVSVLKREKVRAVFLENALDSRAMEGVAREAGIRVGGTLYADGLGPLGSGAESIGGLWITNANTIATALSQVPSK